MTERLLQGVDRALEEDLLDPATAEVLRVEFASPALREQVRRDVEARYALEVEFGLLSAVDVARLVGATAADPEQLVQNWLQQGRVFADRLPTWELALWFTGSNVWVGGERPVDVLDSDPELVVQAAAHLAEELL